jgi:DNA-binding GntR family transcriptional regulator
MMIASTRLVIGANISVFRPVVEERPQPAVAVPGELLADRAYAELRDRIVTLAIAPGEPINEDALGRELEMGRTPVREAIKRLALERLVTVYPRRGTFASEINITDLAAISDVRVQLEGHAARRAAERLTPDQREQLDALVAEIDAREGSGDADALMRLDAEIHRSVYAWSGNAYLQETLERYLNLSLRIWYLVLDRLPHLFDRVHEHRDLLAAIRAGQPKRAHDIAADHVATFETEIRGVL